MLLEVVCFNVSSAIDAANAGADRIELCDNRDEGGTTPSFGAIKVLKETISIPVIVMIRPRGGDFLYTEPEIASMFFDIELAKKIGCEGIALGCLTDDANIDVGLLSRFVQCAKPMEVTFHRAFDRCLDPFKGLEDVIKCGCKRILTSGQRPVALKGTSLIRELITKANERIIVMPGGGITSESIKAIVETTQAKEFHIPAKYSSRTNMKVTLPVMEENLTQVSVDIEDIKKVKHLIQQFRNGSLLNSEPH